MPSAAARRRPRHATRTRSAAATVRSVACAIETGAIAALAPARPCCSRPDLSLALVQFEHRQQIAVQPRVQIPLSPPARLQPLRPRRPLSCQPPRNNALVRRAGRTVPLTQPTAPASRCPPWFRTWFACSLSRRPPACAVAHLAAADRVPDRQRAILPARHVNANSKVPKCAEVKFPSCKG